MATEGMTLDAFLSEHYRSPEWLATVRTHYAYSLPQNALQHDNVDALKRAVTGSGSHFFDRDSMRYWQSRVHGTTLAGKRFFVTSERNADDTARQYRVRWTYMAPTSTMVQVDTLDTHFPTLDRAAVAARKLAELVA